MQEKKIQTVFSEVRVPEELATCVVKGIKVNTDERTLSCFIFLKEVHPINIVNSFRVSLVKAYQLSDLDIRFEFSPEKAMESFDNYKEYIENELFVEAPIYKYILEGSIWETSGNELKITLRHGMEDYINKNKTATKIENIMKRSKIVLSVVFESDPEEIVHTEMPTYYIPVLNTKTDSKTEKPLFLLGKSIDGEPMNISEVRNDSGRVIVEGELFSLEAREIGKGKVLVIFYVSDSSGAVICKFFSTVEKFENVKDDFKTGINVRVRGDAEYDRFEQDLAISARDINKIEKQKKRDLYKVRRVELHAHTQMSSMDGMASAASLVKLAKQYEHKAVAITDHGVVQAFPEAFHEKDKSIKILYGTESYFVNDCDTLIYNGGDYPLNGEMVVFDIETTGLSKLTEEITEIGAVKIKNGVITERFSTFVNPCKPIPQKITELTGITDVMVQDAPLPFEAVTSFMEFCENLPLIAHNAGFDTGFIKETLRKNGDMRAIVFLDTLALCRSIVPKKGRYNLDAMARHFGIANPEHHRAVNDAEVCAAIWDNCVRILTDKGIASLAEIDGALKEYTNISNLKPYHAVIFAKNLVGLKNLYKLISLSHLKYYKRTPRIPKSEFLKHREGLLIGSACEAGELYRALLEGADESKIKALCEFYDYFEIQPVGNNIFMVRDGTLKSEEEIKRLNRQICELGEQYGKLVVATGDVHFLKPEDEVYRRILMAAKGFSDADLQAPLYFRTTAEMLHEFEYLGEELAYRVVVENTNKIADMIDDIRPVPEEKCPPEIEGSAEGIEKMCREKATEIYGNPLPEIVETRMKKELESIIKHGFAVMYMIAHKLVRKSLEDGYLVGSRGSVGSSFVAFLTDITEVNALPPHYVCPNCKNCDFITDGSVGSGCDMADKECPKCGTLYKKDGHDIPFETFLGFNGDKAPDIDLNFSGDYQSVAHKYTEVLFGEGHVFRAGTIGTVADKTAFGFVKHYFEDRGETLGKAEIARLINGCTGVKRTTGQHPGGVIVLPMGHDIHEFTPVQHPADKDCSDIITTHFDYHSIDENLLKLDLLGHDDPTVIRMLEDLTGVTATKIPLDDKDTMSLFLNTDALDVTKEDLGSEVGTYAVPEFGTKFVRQMLVETKPTSFSDLIRISGLSHGTDVWNNNAQDLVRSGTCTLKSCICTRDDIMIYLMYKGLPPSDSFKIMESVRKGKGLKEDWEELMREHRVPEWYISSCKKIKYMFPKAHAAAYVTMAFRIAWFKVHYPLPFYLAYFSVRADSFEYDLMCRGKEKALETIADIERRGKEATAKEKGMIYVLEVCTEMYARGISFCPIDLYKSDAKKFIEDNGCIRPPLNSLPGLGTSAAESIVSEREKGAFIAIDDLTTRTGITKAVVETLKNAGCLDGMQESSQLSMFSI